MVLNQCIPLSLCANNSHTKANEGHQKNNEKDTWPWNSKESPTQRFLCSICGKDELCPKGEHNITNLLWNDSFVCIPLQ